MSTGQNAAALRSRVHATLIDLDGAGVLLLGPSGVGKSECALELLRRGHRLVADDAVELCRTPQGGLAGSAGAMVRGMIEIRGLGLLHVPDLFGPDSVCDQTSIELVCRLASRTPEALAAAERIGRERVREDWLGVPVPRVTLTVPAVANIATLVETALRDLHACREHASGAARIAPRLRLQSAAPDSDAAAVTEPEA